MERRAPAVKSGKCVRVLLRGEEMVIVVRTCVLKLQIYHLVILPRWDEELVCGCSADG